jgi:hypothetical protein
MDSAVDRNGAVETTADRAMSIQKITVVGNLCAGLP